MYKFLKIFVCVGIYTTSGISIYKIKIFFYKTINIINNKYYYGVHITNNINDRYIGGGIKRQSDAKLKNKFHYAVNKYGIVNFKREIIKYFDTYQEALNYETTIVTSDVIADANCYNSKLGGRGGGYVWTDKRKEYHRNIGSYKKSKETRLKLSLAAKERFKNQPGTFTGRTHTLDARKKMSEQHKGQEVSLEKRAKCSNTSKLKYKNATIEEKQKILENIHKARIKSIEKCRVLTPIQILEIQTIFKGRRGEKQELANKYNVYIDVITRVVGKSFTHKAKI